MEQRHEASENRIKKGRKQNIERLPHGISYNGSPHQF